MLPFWFLKIGAQNLNMWNPNLRPTKMWEYQVLFLNLVSFCDSGFFHQNILESNKIVSEYDGVK